MPVLHLGVVEQNYRTPGKKGAMTTFDVAKILESKYHIMEVFFEAHAQDIADGLAQAYQSATIAVVMNPSHAAPDMDKVVVSKVQPMFVEFIDQEQMARLGVPGVPTQAALHGVSHRFKRPYVRRGRRVSFYDTGLYEDSFRAWVDG